MNIKKPGFIVGIGGSAGGLPEYKLILDSLPSDTGMAFVIVCHLVPTASSQLVEILARHTNMPVLQASDAMPIAPNHVYVIPPNADLLIEKLVFKVISPRTMTRSHHTQIDLFLVSLAQAMGNQAIGVILSGYDGDGTEGCKHIKARGGTTFAQDLSAEVNIMPLHARASGCIDFVLPAKEIAERLIQISASFQPADGHREGSASMVKE